MPEPDALADYAHRIVVGSRDWVKQAACLDSTDEVRSFFCCDETDTFTILGQEVRGYAVQQSLVAEWCSACPVQWECARWAIANEMECGVWGMTRRDRRWLERHPNAVGVIDAARRDHVPVGTYVSGLRSAYSRHPSSGG